MTQKAIRISKKLIQAAVKATKVAVKATTQVIKAIAQAIKGIVAAIFYGTGDDEYEFSQIPSSQILLVAKAQLGNEGGDKFWKESNSEFNLENIKPVELNLLNGQVDLILRSLELYSYNLEFMLNSNESSNDERQEKLAMLKYTYEQVLATQAEQVYGKANNSSNNSPLVQNVHKNSNVIDIIPNEKKFNVI